MELNEKIFLSLLRQNIELLIRLGEWKQLDRTLSEFKSILPEEEMLARCELVAEKLRIFQKLDQSNPAGQTYIGVDDVVHLSQGPVRLRFHIKDKDLNAEAIFRAARRAVELGRRYLDYEPGELEINLLGPESVAVLDDIVPGVRSAGACLDKLIIRADLPDAKKPDRLAVIIQHEFFHQAVGAISKGMCPRWLDEGLAVAASQDLPDAYHRVFAESMANDSLLPMESLESPDMFTVRGDLYRLAYTQSASIASFLIDKLSWGGIKNLLEDCGGRGMDQALAERSLNYFLLEKEWQRWLSDKQGEFI